MKTPNVEGQALLARLLAREQIPIVQLLYVELEEPQYVALCGIPLLWGGHTWEPLDIAISELSDSTTELAGLTLQLPGVTPSQIALAFQDVAGDTLRVYAALVDPDTGVVADALLTWSGELDVPGWQDGPQASVLFTAEHRGTAALRVKPSYYTNDEQQRLFPGDTSLDFDMATDSAGVVWPSAQFFRQE